MCKNPIRTSSKRKVSYRHKIIIKSTLTILSRVVIQSGGIKGEVRMTQHSKFEPTFLNFNLSTSKGDIETKLVYGVTVAGYKIHELPTKPAKTVGQNENACLTTKYVYNPNKYEIGNSPPNGKKINNLKNNLYNCVLRFWYSGSICNW